DPGTCDAATGNCSNPGKLDGVGCDDGNSCTTGDACSGGVCLGAGTQLPQLVEGVLVSMGDGGATISWSPAQGSTSSGVLRGLVSQLPVGPGDGDEVCLQNATVDPFLLDADIPTDGESYWYLIRGNNECGAG